ncbi:MAG: M50 family metallopeptidase [Ignavibacteriae bacterium]|nr:M50 family peptidase [Ignavibacteriota bacterium]NOG96407.1 M50 family metallopeptidase [Ignavibacteriota bacterium]
MSKKISRKAKQKLEITVIITIVLLTILFWNSIFIYPIKFSVILFHEISHGIFTIITGGKIIEMKIYSNLSGSCESIGGVPFLIASAGYLGSLVFGWFLFTSAYNLKNSLWTNTIIAILLSLFAISFISSSIGIIASFVLAIILFISPRYLPKAAHSYIMKILGLVSCLYVLVDIKADLLTLEYRRTDAEILHNITGIPAFVWAIVWLAISAAVIYLMIKTSYRKGLTY